MIGGKLDRWLFQRGQTSDGPRLDDLKVQISSYGLPIPIVWGRFRVAGVLMWATDIREVREEREEGDITIVTYSYFSDFAVGICRGPIERLQKIWADGKLIWDLSVGNTGVVSIDGLNFRVYYGDETQLPDPTIEEAEGDGMVPAFRGLSYIVFDDLALEKFGNRIPNLNFEVFTEAQDTQSYLPVDGTDTGSNSDSIMVNPARPTELIYTNNMIWFRVDMVQGLLLFRVDHTFLDIPFNATSIGDFDIDENGIIYTSRLDGSLNFHYQTLDSTDFDPLIDVTVGPQVTNGRSRFCVSLSFLYAIKIGGSIVYVVERESLTLIGGPAQIGAPFAGASYHMLCKGRGQQVWAVASHPTLPGSNSCIISLFNGPFGPTTHFDVTANFRGSTCFIAYDLQTNQVIVATDNDFAVGGNPATIAFFDGTSLAFLGRILAPSLFGGKTYSDFHRGVVNGFLYYSDQTHFRRIDVGNRTLDRTWNVPVGFVAMNGGGVYDPITHSYFQAGGDPAVSPKAIVKVPLDRGSALPVKLFQIVRDICEEDGLDPLNELNTAALTDDVPGYLVNERMPGRSAIEPLMAAYFFDGVESDGVIKFPKRGGSSIVTIPETDLAAHAVDTDRPQELVTKRQQELELPVRVEVMYADYDAEYDTGLQSERRLITRSDSILTFRFSLALTRDMAKQIAVKHLGLAWASRTTHSFSIPRGYLDLDPADVITVTEGGGTHIVRIDSVVSLKDGLLQLEATNEDSSAYISDAIGVPIPDGGDPIEFEGPTILLIADTSLTNQAYDRPGTLVATTGLTPSWRGAQLFRSTDGVTWNPWSTSLVDATVGRAIGVLANPPDPNVWDEGSTITVRLDDNEDSLSNKTELEVLNGANLALLGSELIQFKNAVESSAGSWLLSGLLRGRYGTDWATSTHVTHEPFILLDNDVIFADLPLADFQQLRYLRAQSLGEPSGAGQVVQFTSQMRNLKPLSPEHIKGARHSPATNDWTITWKRRTRVLGDWRDLVDVPLGETTEAYQVDIMNGAVVVRTISVATQSATYTAAMQTSDWGSVQTTITCNVYQISAEIGRGYVRTATL